MKACFKKCLKIGQITAIFFILSLLFFNFSSADAALTFISDYDNDGITATNPKQEELIPSFQIGANHIFVLAVSVQTQGVLKGTQGTLIIWNSATTMTFKSTVQDGGYISFVIGAPYSSDGYNYRVEVAGDVSETRRMKINSQVSSSYDGVKINWDTAGLNISAFPLTLTAQADPSYRISSASLSLGLGQKPVLLKGEIANSTIAFNLKDVPDGQYTGIVLAYTDRGIISSNPRKIIISAGIQAPELNGGQRIITLSRINETQIEAAYSSIEMIAEERISGEKIELIDSSSDPLVDIYTFKITLDTARTQIFSFNAYNKNNQIIFSDKKDISFSTNTPQKVSFILPKGDSSKISEDIAYIELKGSLVQWSQGTGLQILGIPIPNAVSIDLGATGAIPPIFGNTAGIELVINFHSGEITPFSYGGGGIGLPSPIELGAAAHTNLGLIWNLEKNQDYQDVSYQAGGEVAVAFKGFNIETFVPKKADGFLPAIGDYYGIRGGWSFGLIASAGFTAVNSTMHGTWTFSQFLQNPLKVIGQILGIIPMGSPGGGHPDDFAGVIAAESLNQSVDWSKLKGLAYQKNLKALVEYIVYKELIKEKQTYLKNLPVGSTPDENYLNGLEFKILKKYVELESKRYQIWKELNGVTNVVTLDNGFSDGIEKLSQKFTEPITLSEINIADVIQNKNPILILPSGSLYGMENSAFFKASLDEFVKQGGTLVVFAQQHGYEFNILPVPREADGTYKNITGYGWEEDQNCFTNAVSIDTWHQILSGQNRSTPTLNVDGYFTGYPSNSTILLKRTANGQPALLMYEYGAGRVIVTSMYSDWAYGHGQASAEEVALVRDIISWAKAPTTLPEIKPGQTVSVQVEVKNNTATDATSIKIQIYNPDRTTVISEQLVAVNIPAGQSVVIPISYTAAPNAALGIYHADYILLDSTGNIIQPQAETDSGRFAISNPPQTGTQQKQIWFSVSTPNWQVFYGEP